MAKFSDQLLAEFKQQRKVNQTYFGQSEPIWPMPYGEDSAEALTAFVVECCWTLDEETSEISQIPDLPHVRYVCELWWWSRHYGMPLIIEKSRRLLVSWVLSACEVWAMGMKPETRIVSGLNYAKTAQQVWRTAYMYRQSRLRVFHGIEDCVTRGGNFLAQDVREVIFPNGSFIKGLNQESDTFQGSGFSGIRLEEFSHFDHPEIIWGQSYVLTKGRADVTGGHRVAVCNSYPNPGWLETKKISEVLCNNDPTWIPSVYQKVVA